MQILASTEGGPDDDAAARDSDRAPHASGRPSPRPIIDSGGGAPREDGPPAALSRERGLGGERLGPAEETLDGMRAACAEAPAWMLEVRSRAPAPFNQAFGQQNRAEGLPRAEIVAVQAK